MKRYTDSHEWAELNGQEATIGISTLAQKQLGEIVFVELPEIGTTLQAGQEAAVVESTKAATDVYTPLSGTVTAINETLDQDPQKVNAHAESEGWLYRLAPQDPGELDQLLTPEAYQDLVQGSV